MKNKKQASKNEININDIEQQEDKATLLTPVPILDGLEEIEHNLKYLTQTGEIKFSLEILDDATGFIFPGSITLILACPNVGKSLIAQSEACSIAKQGEKVLFCSCEMSPGQLMLRELKKCMGVSNKQLLDGYKKNSNNVSKALNRFKEDEQFNYLNNILILDICDQHIDNLIKTFDNYKDYKYIIVDYVQSLKGTGDDERTQFKDISRKLKTYALRNNVSIIACGQIPKSNENENRTSREGVNFQKLKALGAGNWEQDADLAIKMVEELEGNQTYVLINLSKNRLGELKNVTYKYQKTPQLEFKLISKGY